MIIAPALAVKIFLGKRDGSSDEEKTALDLVMRSNGIAIAANGIHTLFTPVSRQTLWHILPLESMYACYHVGNRVSGLWKKGDGNMKIQNLFMNAAVLAMIIQVAGIVCECDDEEEG